MNSAKRTFYHTSPTAYTFVVVNACFFGFFYFYSTYLTSPYTRTYIFTYCVVRACFKAFTTFYTFINIDNGFFAFTYTYCLNRTTRYTPMRYTTATTFADSVSINRALVASNVQNFQQMIRYSPSANYTAYHFLYNSSVFINTTSHCRRIVRHKQPRDRIIAISKFAVKSKPCDFL